MIPIFIGSHINDEFSGYYGELKKHDFTILDNILKKVTLGKGISEDAVFYLSNLKNMTANIWMEIYKEKNNGNLKNLDLVPILKNVETVLESYNKYDKDVPHMGFLLNFIMLDFEYSKEEDYNSISYFEMINYESDIYEVENTLIPTYIIDGDLIAALSEWESLEGPRLLREASFSEGDEVALMTEIDFWSDDNYLCDDDYVDYPWTACIFRALRNNTIKSIYKKCDILGSRYWKKRMEIL
jgi:hypothetical protein